MVGGDRVSVNQFSELDDLKRFVQWHVVLPATDPRLHNKQKQEEKDHADDAEDVRSLPEPRYSQVAGEREGETRVGYEASPVWER